MHAYSAGTDGESFGFHCKNNDLEHLGDIAHNRLVLISLRKLGISIQEVLGLTVLFVSLELLKPGRKFAGSREIQPILNRCYCKRMGNDYYISVQEHNTARLRINQAYEKILTRDQPGSG